MTSAVDRFFLPRLFKTGFLLGYQQSAYGAQLIPLEFQTITINTMYKKSIQPIDFSMCIAGWHPQNGHSQLIGKI